MENTYNKKEVENMTLLNELRSLPHKQNISIVDANAISYYTGTVIDLVRSLVCAHIYDASVMHLYSKDDVLHIVIEWRI